MYHFDKEIGKALTGRLTSLRVLEEMCPGPKLLYGMEIF